jgi:hypothetical protein
VKTMGYIILCEPLRDERVRIFFSDGLVVERSLFRPGRLQIVDDGLGLRLDNGREIGVYELRQKVRGSRSYELS